MTNMNNAKIKYINFVIFIFVSAYTFALSPVSDDQLGIIAGVNSLLIQRAVAFRQATQVASGKRSGVYVYSSKSIKTYLQQPQKLAARLALLGLNDIYLGITQAALNGSDAVSLDWIKTFNATAHSYNLKVYALRFSNLNMYVDSTLVISDANLITSYNQNVDAIQRFDGASADLEPHTLKEGNTPSGLSIFWDSTNNYGIGNSNDLLLKKTLNILTLAKTKLATLPLNEAIIYNYQDNVNNGNLKYGASSQFLTSCESVILMAYSNSYTTIWNRGEVVLDATTTLESVTICMKTSLDTTGGGADNTSLQPQGWNSLIESILSLNAQASTYKSWRGFGFFEFEGLEQMWLSGVSTDIKRLDNNNVSCIIKDNTIIVKGLLKNDMLAVYDLTAKIIYQSRCSGEDLKININDIITGYYFISIRRDQASIHKTIQISKI